MNLSLLSKLPSGWFHQHQLWTCSLLGPRPVEQKQFFAALKRSVMNFKNWAFKKEEQTYLVDEEGGEAEDGLLLHHRASFLQAGHVELPAEKKTFEGNCCEEKNNEKKHWRLQTNKQTKMLTNRPSLRYSQNMWSWNEELTFPAERWWAGWWWGHPWKPLSSFDQGRSLTENQIPKLFSLLRSNVEGESIKALKVVKSKSETKHPQSRWECEMGWKFSERHLSQR